METRKDSFVVYAGDLKEVVDELSDEQVATLFRAMISYQLTGVAPKLSGVLKFAFIPIRQSMDRNDEKYERICERNRRNAVKRWESKREKTEQADATVCDRMRSDAVDADNERDNERDNDRDRDNDRESAEADVWSLSLSVLSHLNEVTGSSWRVDDAASVRLISDLAHKGYTEEQMLEVIDKKAADWLGDPKVEQYLRPSTLFGQHFEEYLRQPASAQKKKREEAEKKVEAKQAVRDQIEARSADLLRLGEEYEQAYGDVPLRIDLRGKMAAIEAELEALRARA